MRYPLAYFDFLFVLIRLSQINHYLLQAIHTHHSLSFVPYNRCIESISISLYLIRIKIMIKHVEEHTILFVG